MKTYYSKFPRWNGGHRIIGIAKKSITDDLKVVCLYKDSAGNLIYPNPFFIEKTKALSYPGKKYSTQYGGETPILKEIPIEDMHEITDKDYFEYCEVNNIKFNENYKTNN